MLAILVFVRDLVVAVLVSLVGGPDAPADGPNSDRNEAISVLEWVGD